MLITANSQSVNGAGFPDQAMTLAAIAAWSITRPSSR